MNKVVVIGSPGAGKSTFARELGKILDINVLHLDRYFWQPGWKEYSREERIAIQRRLISEMDQWIIEGTYLSSSDERLGAADTIIFLDMPAWLCLKHIIQRHITIHRKQERPDIPKGCTDKLGPLSLLKVLVFPYKGRNLLIKKLRNIYSSGAPDAVEEKFYRLSSTQDMTGFLQGLSVQRDAFGQEHKIAQTFDYRWNVRSLLFMDWLLLILGIQKSRSVRRSIPMTPSSI